MPPSIRPASLIWRAMSATIAEVSDDPIPWRLQLWLRSVFALAERVSDLVASTLSAKRRILVSASRCDLT